jgi:hypothetical protein
MDETLDRPVTTVWTTSRTLLLWGSASECRSEVGYEVRVHVVPEGRIASQSRGRDRDRGCGRGQYFKVDRSRSSAEHNVSCRKWQWKHQPTSQNIGGM